MPTTFLRPSPRVVPNLLLEVVGQVTVRTASVRDVCKGRCVPLPLHRGSRPPSGHLEVGVLLG
eukprot:8473014-Prorocentrum_lima.AAC.1